MLNPPKQIDGNRAHLRLDVHNGRLRLVAGGPWTVRELPAIYAELAAANAAPPKGVTGADIDLTDVREFDTAGAWAIKRVIAKWRGAGLQVMIRGATEEQKILIEEVTRHESASWPAKPAQGHFAALAVDTASALTSIGRDLVRLTGFLGEVTARGLRTLMRPWRFRFTSFIHHIDRAGLRAVPIVALICLLIGAVIMQQGIVQLRYFGGEVLAVDTLGILALREIGILLCAILVAGRSASAFTAEIGTMKMREEIDALRTLGIDPIETLVLPRILALIVALPLLVFIGDIMCLAGGAIMAKIYLQMDLPLYAARLNNALDLRHFMVGLVKAPFAALVIGLVGCLEGLSVTGSAESVGTHVTSAVVKAIFLVLVLDGAFAIFLSASGY